MRLTAALRALFLMAALPAVNAWSAPPAVPAGLEFRQTGYFELRHDARKCPSPMCGGYWLKRVNQPLTVCADGKQRAQCYVAEIEGASDALLDTFEPVLVRGSLRPRDYPGAGGTTLNFGYFRVLGGWRAAAPGAPISGESRKLHYAGIESSGIVCIMAPCQSFTEYVLNSPRQRLITGVDLDAAGAAPEVQQKAIDTVAAGGVLLVRGLTRQSADGAELVFEAQQFYLPVR